VQVPNFAEGTKVGVEAMLKLSSPTVPQNRTKELIIIEIALKVPFTQTPGISYFFAEGRYFDIFCSTNTYVMKTI